MCVSMKEKTNNCQNKCSHCQQPNHSIIELAEKVIKSICNIFDEMAAIKIKRKVLREAMEKIGSIPAESGGILLGPRGCNYVTHFYFDRGSRNSSTSYTPDYKTLNLKMRTEWKPAGLRVRGFIHSHPGNLDTLTAGDISYIQKLMDRNNMDMFVAPIILPHQYSIRPWVVSRNNMYRVQQAYFEIID